MHGTAVGIGELTVFDKINGHFSAYTLDNKKIFEDYVSYKITDDEKEIEYSINGTDISYTYTETGTAYDGTEALINEAVYGNGVFFDIADNNIKFSAHLCIFFKDGVFPEIVADLIMNVNYSDGEFTFSDLEIEKFEY